MTAEENDENGGCCENFKAQFKLRMFLLEHAYPGWFHKAKLAKDKSVLYLIWRVFSVILLGAIIGLSAHFNQFYASSQENRRKWLLFMTNWALVVLTISALIDMITSFYFYFNKEQLLRGEAGPMPWYVKLFWVMMNIGNAMGIVVSVVYWVALHDYSLGFAGYRIQPFLTHGLNVIYIFINLFIVAMPVRILHFYQTSIFFAVYMIFNAIYVLAGGTNDIDQPFIYPILNWKTSPGLSTGIAIAGTFLSALAHVVIYLLHLLREQLFRACTSRNRVV